jgi:hypothetical protein
MNDTNEEVGYGRPPTHTRFPKGTSGNPRGRPKGSAGFREIIRKAFMRKATVKEGGKRRKITMMEAAFTKLIGNAANGDPKAAKAVVDVIRMLGLEPPEKEAGISFVIEG